MKKQFSHLLCAAALLLSGPLAIAQSDERLQKAQAGDAQAQFKLAAVYLTGRGGPKNDDEAAKWFMLAAKQGHAESQANMGLMYGRGRGVPQSDEEAVKWYRLAAEQGDANSQFNVGSMYALGRGVSQSWPQAYFWALLAAKDGEKDSARQQEIIAKKLKPAQRAKIQQQVQEWKPRAGNS